MKKDTPKTCETQFRASKLTTIVAKQQFLVNKKIRILGNTCSHQLGPIGTILEIPPNIYISGNQITGIIPGQGGYITIRDFVVITEESKKDVEDNIKLLEKEIKSCKEKIIEENNKLEYMKATNSEKYNENEFKAFTTLKLLENNDLTTLEKAKVIAKLIN